MQARHPATRPPAFRLPGLLGLAALLLGCLPLGACGGSAAADGTAALGLGTVVLRNETDQGMAPVTVTAFYLQPDGGVPGGNLLSQPAAPGGVVILGLFPEGRYDATAVLETGLNVNFLDMQVAAGQPTNFVVPGN